MLSCLYSKLSFLLLSLVFTSIGYGQALNKFSFAKPLMGSKFLFVCFAKDSLLATETANKAFDRIEELNNILSDYHPESEINLLSENYKVGIPQAISKDLWQILERSLEVSASTNGLFDVTIGNCTKLWRRAKRKGKLPTSKALRNTLENTGYQNIRLIKERQSVIFLKPEIKLDFGGIAKGYAADEAFKIFKNAGIEQIMIDAGGDIYCGKAPPNTAGWSVKIVPGIGNDTLNANISYKAIATSGDLYRFFELEGIRYSHIINPNSCQPIVKATATTVISDFAEKADYLASVANVSGMAKEHKKILRKQKKIIHHYIHKKFG